MKSIDEKSAYAETSTNIYSSTIPNISYKILGNLTVGCTIDICVNISNGSNIYGASLDLLFDDTLLEIISCKIGTLFEKDLNTPLINSTTNGRTSFVLTLSGANKSLSNSTGSLVIITANIKKEGTLNLKTTDTLSNLSLNGYTSCIKLSKKNSDKITFNYSDASFTFALPPILSPGTYNNMNSNLIYSAYWITAADSSHHYSNSKNSYLIFGFKGTGFAINSIKANNRGIAKVYIDNLESGSFDSYSSTIVSEKVFAKIGLEDKEHTCKIIVTSNKNSASSNYYISIKSIDIFPSPLNIGSYDNNNQNLMYSGSWITAADSSHRYSNSKDSYLEFSFNGTGFAINSIKANNRGIAKVYIDNLESGSIDGYSSNVTSAITFIKNDLTPGKHLCKIIVTNSKNSASSGYYISIKSIDILSPSLNTGNYSNTNSNLIYYGSWIRASNSYHIYSNSKNNSLNFCFNGTGFSINSMKANNRGIAKVYIDNIDCGSFDNYSSTIVSEKVFTKIGLEDKEHTCKIIVTNSKNPASSNYYISIISIDIFCAYFNVGTYDCTNPDLIYWGSWRTAADSSHRYSNSKDSYLEFSFNGTGFTINSIKANNRGIAKVYIDNIESGYIDGYSSNVTSDITFTKNNLTSGKHVCKIVVTNSKNPASSNYYFSLKSITILSS
ncbi:MAG: cellulosome anchor protein [Clostridium sp.]|nr:cellulosome anchor protein [Clostridium sp.]